MEHEVNYEPRLLDPPLLQEAATVGYVAALVSSVSLPVLADRAAEVVDSSSLRYLTAAALRQREEEERQKRFEEREEAKKRADEMQSLLSVPRDLRTPAQLRRFQELAAQSSDSWVSLRRKRKKKRKKKAPKASSSRGRARRRQRQWHFCVTGSTGYVPLPVFPLVSGRLVMLGIMAGMEQKGFKFVDIPFVLQTLLLMVQTIQQTTEFLQLLYVSGGRCTCCVGRAYHAALVSTTTVCAQGWLCWFRCASSVFLLIFGILAGMDQKDSCRGMYRAGIAGYNTPRAVLSFLVRRPMKLGIMASIFLKDSCSGSSMYKASFAGDCAHRAVFSSPSQAYDVLHHGRYGPEGQLHWYGRPMMFNVTAAMDSKDSCDVVPMFRLQKTAESPQLQSVQVVDISFVPQRQIPMVQAIQ